MPPPPPPPPLENNHIRYKSIQCAVLIGSYTCAYALLNSLNELRKRKNTWLVEHFIPFSQQVQ